MFTIFYFFFSKVTKGCHNPVSFRTSTVNSRLRMDEEIGVEVKGNGTKVSDSSYLVFNVPTREERNESIEYKYKSGVKWFFVKGLEGLL